jgi:hypothetical protein
MIINIVQVFAYRIKQLSGSFFEKHFDDWTVLYQILNEVNSIPIPLCFGRTHQVPSICYIHDFFSPRSQIYVYGFLKQNINSGFAFKFANQSLGVRAPFPPFAAGVPQIIILPLTLVNQIAILLGRPVLAPIVMM